MFYISVQLLVPQYRQRWCRVVEPFPMWVYINSDQDLSHAPKKLYASVFLRSTLIIGILVLSTINTQVLQYYGMFHRNAAVGAAGLRQIWRGPGRSEPTYCYQYNWASSSSRTTKANKIPRRFLVRSSDVQVHHWSTATPPRTWYVQLDPLWLVWWGAYRNYNISSLYY